MKLPIYVIGSQVLKKQAEEINKDYEGLNELIENMFETMYNSDGVGLAAPQIGKSIRLFILDATPMAEEDESLKGFKKVFINAQITDYLGEEIYYNEGCLSVPGIREDVKRFEKIKIKYYDENFNFHEEEFDGIKAWIVQHEYDHTEGILFVEKLSSIRKKIIKNKLRNIASGKFEANYKAKIA